MCAIIEKFLIFILLILPFAISAAIITPGMNYFFNKYRRVLLVVFLDLFTFFLLGFLGFQIDSFLTPPPKGPEIVRNPLTPYIFWMTLTIAFITQVLVISFIHNKLLKTKREIKIAYLLFFILASSLPFYYLISAYSAAFARNAQCQAEIALGNYSIACRNEDFGKGVVVLIMVFIYILLATSVSLFINLRSYNLKAHDYKNFIVKTIIILFFLCIIFISFIRILSTIETSRQPKVIPLPENQKF